MREEWPEIALGETLTLDVETADVVTSETYEIVGVLNRGRGILPRDPLPGSATSYKTLNRIRPGQVVYSRLKAFEGAITVVPDDIGTAYASQEFPTFTCGRGLLPGFFRLLTTTPILWDALQSISTGMGGRRERVKPADFLRLRLTLPSLPIQQRIVDIIGAIEDHIVALDGESTAGDAARAGVLDYLLGRRADKWESATLGESGSFFRGRRFTKKDYVDSGLGCIHYGQIYTDFEATATQTVTFVPEEFRSRMRLAHSGDLVVAGTSENVQDVGKAVAWLGDDDVAVHDDCYIYRHNLDPSYASYFLASALFHTQKLKYVSETKVVRISGANLAKIEIPVPPRDEQERIAKAIDAVDGQVVATRTEAKRLRAVRAGLLSALLNREVEIAEPEKSAA